MKGIFTKIKTGVRTITQRLVITLELFGGNGLANHAAAGAYGFLLSVAPMLLLIAFIILFAFKSSPQLISALIGNISFLEIVFNEEWLTGEFLSVSKLGISGVISVLSVFWAGRILVLAVQRGLKVIFLGTKNRNPVTDTLVTLAVEVIVLVVLLVFLFGSQTALRLYKALDFFSMSYILHFGASKAGNRLISYGVLWFISFFAYLLVPVNSPRKLSALRGAVLFVFAYGCIAIALGNVLDPAKYNFLYGALGSLIVLLVNVYFFFYFFFFGAQLAFVIDCFDALLFAKLRQARKKAAEKGAGRSLNVFDKLFFYAEGTLRKYLISYKKGETIFSQGDSGNEVYFILEGELEVIISSSQQDIANSVETLRQGSFFGEMSYLLSENRSATVMAKTDLLVLALPPLVFEKILKFDSNLDRTIIEHMSRRLKNSNEHIAALESSKLFDDN